MMPTTMMTTRMPIKIQKARSKALRRGGGGGGTKRSRATRPAGGRGAGSAPEIPSAGGVIEGSADQDPQRWGGRRLSLPQRRLGAKLCGRRGERPAACRRRAGASSRPKAWIARVKT